METFEQSPVSSRQRGTAASFHDWILGRICVRPPYFRLERCIAVGVEGVAASVVFESPVGLEAGSLATAEIGRHLAIVGSCALARRNPSLQRHFYLATEATLSRRPLSTPHDGTYRVRGTATADDTALAELTDGSGVVLATLACRYRVAPERVFMRIFRQQCQDGSPVPCPDAHARALALTALELDGPSASALLPCVEPAMCAGHFDEVPAMPVARLMDGIQRLACEHVVRGVGRSFRFRHADIRAERLAFAGETVRFGIEQQERAGDQLVYRGWATNEDGSAVFGEARIEYELLPA